MRIKNAPNLAFSLFIFLLLFLNCSDDTHQTDNELINNFQSHQAEFEDLLRMIREDTKQYKGLFRVDRDWVAPENLEKIGVSQKRIVEYREIFQKLNIQRGFYAYENGTVMFISSARGMSVSGSSKGYLWLAEPCKNMTDDTDEFLKNYQKNYQNLPPEQKNTASVCRHIQGNWYLYRDWD